MERDHHAAVAEHAVMQTERGECASCDGFRPVSSARALAHLLP
jgi:hypothetical protein